MEETSMVHSKKQEASRRGTYFLLNADPPKFGADFWECFVKKSDLKSSRVGASKAAENVVSVLEVRIPTFCKHECQLTATATSNLLTSPQISNAFRFRSVFVASELANQIRAGLGFRPLAPFLIVIQHLTFGDRVSLSVQRIPVEA
eukprot:scaffold21422_cov103-Skeletonema_dohrnii-CCMP3373.AAC.4